MDKVALTRERAEAIENIKEIYNNYPFIIKSHVQDSDGWFGKSEPLKDLNLDSLIRALYIGYEVEQTREEKLKEQFDISRNLPFPAYTNGIRDTLNILGITIPGINSEVKSDE